MKPIATRMLAAALALALCTPLAAAAPQPSVLAPDKLVILSTTDVKGKTSPCGCHVPKGGLARRASFRDSMKVEYGQILLVDAGGFAPDHGTHSEPQSFLMEAMPRIGTDAVGVGDRDLRFGLAFLREEMKRTQCPLTSANLIEKKTGRPALPASIVKTVGTVKVGVFSVMSDQMELGPAGDSLLVEAPPVTAARMVADLRKKGATVIVMLSQLGKIETEDLVAAVDGIDVAIAGRNVPMLQKGRLIKSTTAVYGGEQGHYLGRTIVSLNAAHKPTGTESEVFMLGPEVGDEPQVAKLVKTFEDGFNEKTKAGAAAAKDGEKPAVKLP